MNAKDTVSKGYDCFSKGDMETFFNEVIHDDCVWTHPGVPGKHPLSGVHNGKQAMMEGFSKIPAMWENFQVCLLYTSPSPRDATLSRMPSSA